MQLGILHMGPDLYFRRSWCGICCTSSWLQHWWMERAYSQCNRQVTASYTCPDYMLMTEVHCHAGYAWQICWLFECVWQLLFLLRTPLGMIACMVSLFAAFAAMLYGLSQLYRHTPVPTAMHIMISCMYCSLEYQPHLYIARQCRSPTCILILSGQVFDVTRSTM